MIAPTAYEGTIILSGRVGHYLDALNPQNWSIKAPEIWQESYLVAPSLAPAGELPYPSRASTPGQSTPAGPGTIYQAWNEPRLFFEDVRTVGFHYRNVLETKLSLKGPKLAPTYFDFTFDQYDCLNTESAFGLAEGGIDVDFGYSRCSQDAPDRVKIDIAKTVRYSQPAALVGELNALAELLVPLTFDSWLHALTF